MARAGTEVATARGGAALLVAAVTEGGRTLAEALADPALGRLSPAERARAQRLATETLRQLQRADRVLKPHLRRLPPGPVLAVLRCATVEMLALGAPPHGVVAEAVTALGLSPHTRGFAGLANAVLRKAAGFEGWAALPVPELPGWLRGRLMSAWGKAATRAIEAAHLGGAALDLTPRDGDATALAARLGGVALPTGSVRLAGARQVSALAGYAEGDWWVQDAAAALPVRVLAPRRGERVADLCAAPGGKTLQLAAAGAEVTAVDLSAPRLERLAQNLARCRLAATVVAGDALAWRPAAPLDAVLVDAPCSATGTVRRHPDLPFAKDPAGLRPLQALQRELIDHALTLVGPGGRVVFCTCSLLPEEGERQLAEALDRHPGLVADRGALALPGVEPGWITEAGGLRLRPDFWPDRGGMDGFFIACLRRG